MDPALGGRAPRGRQEGKLEGPLETVEYQGKIWAIPHTSNTQLLWYRKDRVDPPPDDFTWDEMIDQAVDKGTAVEVQAAQYEGLVVWINALIAGAGGQIVDENGDVEVDHTAKTRRGDREQARQLGRGARRACPPTARTPAGWASSRAAPTTRSTTRTSTRAPPRWARTSRRTSAGRATRAARRTSRARRRSAASTSPSRRTRTTPTSPSRRPSASRQPENQALSAELGGLPPTTESVYDDPKVQKAYPFADELRESIDDAAPRPVTPAYSDISLAIQKTYHPPDAVDPDTVVEQLRDRIEKAVDGKIF